MPGRASRNKGKGGERELAMFLSAVTGLDINRALGQARNGGADILDLPGFVIEVKRQERLQLDKWWEQVLSAANGTDKLPVLAYRQNSRKWQFCLPMLLLVPGGSGFFTMRQKEFVTFLQHVRNGASHIYHDGGDE